MPSVFKRIEGRHGKITVPSIGLEIGQMEYWMLLRRENTPSESEAWDFRAVFSYINKFSFDKRANDRQVQIALGDTKRGGKQYRLEETGGRTVLDGQSLLMERVKLCLLEKAP